LNEKPLDCEFGTGLTET